MATDAPSSLKIIDVHTCIYNQPHLQLLVVKYPKHHYRMAATSKWIYKYLSLVILILQNTLLVLVMRYSRTVTVDGLRYLPSTAVVMSELLKLLTCFIMVCYGVQWNTIRAISQLHTEIVRNGREMFKLSVPAILYTIQNNLLYIALTYLDAATFQVCTNCEILHVYLLTKPLSGMVLIYNRIQCIYVGAMHCCGKANKLTCFGCLVAMQQCDFYLVWRHYLQLSELCVWYNM